jgi:hypothetical protein
MRTGMCCSLLRTSLTVDEFISVTDAVSAFHMMSFAGCGCPSSRVRLVRMKRLQVVNKSRLIFFAFFVELDGVFPPPRFARMRQRFNLIQPARIVGVHLPWIQGGLPLKAVDLKWCVASH